VVIVSPALAAANNGNWQTARRWRALLSAVHPVRIAPFWPDGPASGTDEVLLALHARRSAPSIQAWAQARGGRGLAVVLTGTDLYQDLAHDPLAQASVQAAARLVVLQDEAPAALPEAVRDKVRVVFQSSTSRQALVKGRRFLRVAVVGHLRDVKSPQTVFDAAGRLDPGAGIRIDHYGEATGDWADRARATMAACPHYRWCGAVPHAQARRAIQRAHLLVHPSLLEGGAHVIMEAVCSGTPVLASAVPGNIGMLGRSYPGYFPARDADALAALLARCRREQLAPPHDPADALLARLQAQCEARAPRFAPEAERAALLALVRELKDTP